MNLRPNIGPAERGHRAFTFVEMMVASAIFGLVISAVVYTNMVGLKLLDISRPKQEAEAQSARLYDLLVEDIAAARDVEVGNGDPASFTPIVGEGAPRQGNALKILPGADTNISVLYYREATDQTLRRATNGEMSGTVVARAVTNSTVFTAEDRAGAILTQNQRNMAIGVVLSFALIERSATPVGPGQYFESYQFRTRVTRRSM